MRNQLAKSETDGHVGKHPNKASRVEAPVKRRIQRRRQRQQANNPDHHPHSGMVAQNS